MQLSKNSYSANVTTGQLVIEHRHTNAQTTHRPRAPYLLSHPAPITAVYSLVRLHHCQCACVWRWWMYKPQHVSTFGFESLFFQGFLVTLASKKFIGLFFLNFSRASFLRRGNTSGQRLFSQNFRTAAQ